MWRGEKEHSFLETSRKDDHMPWPPRSLQTSRKSIHLALAKKASRMCPCAPLLIYFLDSRFVICIIILFRTMLFCLKTPKHFYIRGSLTLVKGLNILEKLNTFVYQPL